MRQDWSLPECSHVRDDILRVDSEPCLNGIMVEVTDSGKRSSLLRYGINYDRKKFYGESAWTDFLQFLRGSNF